MFICDAYVFILQVVITPQSISSSSKDITQPLSINVLINENDTAGQSSSLKRSPNSPDAAKALNNDINRSVVSSSKQGRWICKACTYENWPRTFKCVLCGVPRGKTYVDIVSKSSSSESISELGAGSVSNRSVAKRLSPPGSARHQTDSENENEAVGGATCMPRPLDSSKVENTKTDQDNKEQEKSRGEEKRLRQLKKRLRDSDWLWLNACQGVVDGDIHAVEAYLSSCGNATRQLTKEECAILNRPSAFEVGYTLVHLSIRFQREDMLAALLTASEVVKKGKKRVPSHASPDLASEQLRIISASLRQRKGDLPCYFFTDVNTFSLPAG